MPLAAAIGLEAGEEVQWELLDRGELHLTRNQLPQVQATQRATQPAEIPPPSRKRLLKANGAVYLTEVTHDLPVSENSARNLDRRIKYGASLVREAIEEL